MRKLIPCFLIFISVFLIYKFIYPNPRNWYDHYRYLAGSFLAGRLDVPNLPSFYQDSLEYQGKKYLPFPPIPAIILAPIIAIQKNITQQQVSIVIGALNAVLVFLLLKKFTEKAINALLLSLFFAFGTASFWSAVVGTTWYFAHNTALMFFLLSLIVFKSKKYFLSGFLFSLAVLSRLPILLGIVFYILELRKDKTNLLKFLSAVLVCIPIMLFYNWLRFGNIFHSGYIEVYKGYVGTGYSYTLLQLLKPNYLYFGYLDPRNIPLHLFTFFLMPPILSAGKILPSPYGMGIVFTTPLLLVALLPPFKKSLEKNLLIGVALIALVDFLHYMQGWVQFGYRFLLDFLPFLLIILAIRFKPKKLYLLLLAISVAVNFWGVHWAIKLGW